MPSRSRGRFLLFVAPLSAVAVVLLGVVSGGVRPFRSARVYSGPTQGIAELSLRLEVGDRDSILEVPVAGAAFGVEAIEGGQRVAAAQGRTDALGNAEVVLRLPRPRDSAFELRVQPVGHDLAPLAHGLVLGRTDTFRALATHRGGFQSVHGGDDIELAVAPAHGVLVTAGGALADELVVRARRANAPLVGAIVKVKLDGAEPSASQILTDADGLARLEIRPIDPQVQVSVVAFGDGISKGMLNTRFEVVQGAIRVTRHDDRLRIESIGAASHAYLGFFDQNQRYRGLSTPLSSDPQGLLSAELPWPRELTASPLWVVASSQADLASPSAVGWPIVGVAGPDPQTFDARELLLLDGAPLARLREDRRARRIRFVTAGYATLALLVTLLLFVRRVRDAERAIEQHLSRSGIDDAALDIAPAKKGRALLAAACIALGFIVLAVFALLKE